MRYFHRFLLFLFVSALLIPASPLAAQVTTATLVGLLRDSSAAVIPGATSPEQPVNETSRFHDTWPDQRVSRQDGWLLICGQIVILS